MKIRQLFESQADMATIVSECSQFFSQTASGLLFRGLVRTMYDPTKVTARPNRRPSNSSIEMHEALDDAFEQKFGHRYRSSCTFATSNVTVARAYAYSTLAIVLPVNGIRFCWSPEIDDLYEYIIRGMKVKEAEIPDDRERLLQCVQEAIATYQETDLQACLDSGHEIMIATPVWMIPEESRHIKDRVAEIRNKFNSYLRT